MMKPTPGSPYDVFREIASMRAFALVEAATEGTPSEATWNRICDLLEPCLAAGIGVGALDLVEAVIEDWPDYVRSKLPNAWRAQLAWGIRPWMAGPLESARVELLTRTFQDRLFDALGEFVYWNGMFDVGADFHSPTGGTPSEVMARSMSYETRLKRTKVRAQPEPPFLLGETGPRSLGMVAQLDLGELRGTPVRYGSSAIVQLFGDLEGHEYGARVVTEPAAGLPRSFVWERGLGELHSLSFHPRWTFQIEGFGEEHVALLPDDLVSTITDLLGCRFEISEHFESAIGGRPATRRGEFFYFDGYFFDIHPDPSATDPRWYEELAIPYMLSPWTFDNALFDEMLRVDRFSEYWNVEPFHEVISRTLLFQQDLSNDDFYHYRQWWVDTDDLRRGTLTNRSFTTSRAFGE